MNKICQFFKSSKWEVNDPEISSTEKTKVTAPSAETCITKSSVESGISSNSDTTVVDASDTTSFVDTTISSIESTPITSHDDIANATSTGSNDTSCTPQLDKDVKATSVPSDSAYPYRSPVMYNLNDDNSLKPEDYSLSDTSSLFSSILEADNVSTIMNSTMKQDDNIFSKVYSNYKHMHSIIIISLF